MFWAFMFQALSALSKLICGPVHMIITKGARKKKLELLALASAKGGWVHPHSAEKIKDYFLRIKINA